MTAVDHAELKRLAEGATPGPWFMWCGCAEDGGHPAHANSERNYGLFVTDLRSNLADDVSTETGAFIAAANPAVVLALLSEIEGLKSYAKDAKDAANEALEYRRQLAALRTQAPDSWRSDREAVARIVDGLAFGVTNDPATDGRREAQRDTALAKADAILALLPQTAESGK